MSNDRIAAERRGSAMGKRGRCWHTEWLFGFGSARCNAEGQYAYDGRTFCEIHRSDVTAWKERNRRYQKELDKERSTLGGRRKVAELIFGRRYE